ncbi:hypothetical protein GQ457_15G019080 [Hibiscus cannabinus]
MQSKNYKLPRHAMNGCWLFYMRTLKSRNIDNFCTGKKRFKVIEVSVEDLDEKSDPQVLAQKLQKLKGFTLGSTFLLFKSYRLTKNANDLSLCLVMVDACNSASLSSRDVTFFCGRAGVCALGAVAARYAGNQELLNHYLTQFREIKLSRNLSDELLYGRAGYLWAFLFLNKHLGEGTIPSTTKRAVVDEIIKNGRALGKKTKAKPNKISPLNDPPKIPSTWTIYAKTLGCSHNQSDSEYMAGKLSSFGYAISDNPDERDLWLINTCTVKNPSHRDLKELEGVSIVGVQQIGRVVEVVEETLKGHEVRLLNRKTLPALDLPKVRKNKFVEILPINVGCLGACTYCKTKHARGHLGSYIVDSLLKHVKIVIADGVKEIWLSSEDTGAYGREIGVNLPILLNAIVVELPPDGSTMLRIRMTNPPFVLEHMKEIATDIICGFPVETDEDFAQPVNLIKEYKFPQVHISQFYPRHRVERIWITKIATDGIHLVDHTKGYVQVLIIVPESILGSSAMVKITFVGRWSVFGEVIEVLTQIDVQKALNNVPN